MVPANPLARLDFSLDCSDIPHKFGSDNMVYHLGCAQVAKNYGIILDFPWCALRTEQKDVRLNDGETGQAPTLWGVKQMTALRQLISTIVSTRSANRIRQLIIGLVERLLRAANTDLKGL